MKVSKGAGSLKQRDETGEKNLTLTHRRGRSYFGDALTGGGNTEKKRKKEKRTVKGRRGRYAPNKANFLCLGGGEAKSVVAVEKNAKKPRVGKNRWEKERKEEDKGLRGFFGEGVLSGEGLNAVGCEKKKVVSEDTKGDGKKRHRCGSPKGRPSTKTVTCGCVIWKKEKD